METVRSVWPAPSPDAHGQAPEDSAPGGARATLGHERGPARALNSPTLRHRGVSPPLATWKLPVSASASRGSVWENSSKAVFVLLCRHLPRLEDRGCHRPDHVGTVTAQKLARTQTVPTDISRRARAEGTHPDTLRCLAAQNAGP